MAVQQQLSGTIVVIIIAMCVQVCIMLVIVVKRQIMRFALRNRRGPHTHVGQGAPKMLRREIDRQLDYVNYIRHEPEPVTMKDDNFDYRLAALKELRLLEENIFSFQSSYARPPCGNVRSFLLNCINGPLLGVNSHNIHLLCDDYEHARHHYESFDDAKFKVFKKRVEELHEAIEKNRQRKPSPLQHMSSQNQNKKVNKLRRRSEEKSANAALMVTTSSNYAGSGSSVPV